MDQKSGEQFYRIVTAFPSSLKSKYLERFGLLLDRSLRYPSASGLEVVSRQEAIQNRSQNAGAIQFPEADERSSSSTSIISKTVADNNNISQTQI